MGEAETEALDAGLAEAFSLLTTGGQAQLRATLQLVAWTTLSTPAGAQLWASLLEVATAPEPRRQLLGQRLRLRAHQRGVGDCGRPAGRQLVWALRGGLAACDASAFRPGESWRTRPTRPTRPSSPRCRRRGKAGELAQLAQLAPAPQRPSRACQHSWTAQPERGLCNQSVHSAPRACTVHPEPAWVDWRGL
jgi:hypothetical protein